MKMLFARASVPAWVVILGLGALLAPAGIATTVFLVALGLACIPAVISIGVWKRTASGDLTSSEGLTSSGGRKASDYREPTAGVMGVWHAARRAPKTIDAEFVVEDVTPEKRHP
jgi:hypothetical protein